MSNPTVRTDVHEPATRRLNMQRIRSKDTKPELVIRRGLYARGYRFRLHVRELPGQPDLVFPRYRAVILVHGCFWHGHDCPLSARPKTNAEFWASKIAANCARDTKVELRLADAEWRRLTVWECALRGRARWNTDDLMEACGAFLTGTQPVAELFGVSPANEGV
jgi:DNA mismatch endonuclease, patch repair protein